MATPWIHIKSIKARNYLGPQWVKVDVADQFVKIDVLVADNRFITILEKMTTPAVEVIEIHRIAGQQSPHESGKLRPVATEKQVEMIG